MSLGAVLGWAPVPAERRVWDALLHRIRALGWRQHGLRRALTPKLAGTAPAERGAVDLDNLARKVIPHVHDVLEPPSMWRVARPIDQTDTRLVEFFDKQARIAKRLPKHQVTRYEVIDIPRTSSDPPEGSVRLVLCDGVQGRTFAEFIDSAIKEWDEDDF